MSFLIFIPPEKPRERTPKVAVLVGPGEKPTDVALRMCRCICEDFDILFFVLVYI